MTAAHRIPARFAQLRADCRKALVAFITAGDPRPEWTLPLMHELVSAGADMIELGVPFSDPMADGPVIQAASERALKHHVSLRQVLDMVREFRRDDDDTPVVLMGYLNPIEVMGYEAFSEAAQAAGVDGALTVDLPPEESHDLVKALQQHAIDPIFLLAPTSTPERMQKICAAASGFVYYVSLKGVTGAANLDVDQVRDKLAQIRASTDLPVGVGFGIRDAASARQVAGIADAVIVGSVLVRLVEQEQQDLQALRRRMAHTLSAMREAMDEKEPAAASQG